MLQRQEPEPLFSKNEFNKFAGVMTFLTRSLAVTVEVFLRRSDSFGERFFGLQAAAGAACIIYAFRTGGLPLYVMPLVFGGAPIVNVLVSMAIHPPKSAINPMLYVGFLLASAGAAMVLYFRPTS